MLAVFCGLSALAGHVWPVWLGFKGGKGVATAAGILFAMNWIAALIGLGVWLLFFVPSRRISLGSIAAAVAVPVANHFTGDHLKARWESPLIVTVFFAVAAALVILRHRENIRRLRAGTEPRFGRKP